MNKNNTKWPKLSVITPTLNAERTIEFCFASVKKQNYKGLVEIVVADGGSIDNTVNIARKYKAKIIENRLKTGEAGKAVGVKNSTGEILVFLDSDNVLPSKNWFTQMVKPFVVDKNVVATEPISFSYRRKDHWLTRYFALLGMGDPLSLFVGNYDRYSYVSNKWTNLKLKEKDKKYGKEVLLDRNIPTIGANGFLIRKKELEKYEYGKYLFDIDVIKYLSREGPVIVVKVKTGVVHLFSGNVSTFIRKQKRRARDYFFHRRKGTRIIDRTSLVFPGVVKFVLATIFIIPLLLQTLIGYMRKRDSAWLFHPIACWITLFVYSTETIRSFIVTEEFSRRKWSQ